MPIRPGFMFHRKIHKQEFSEYWNANRRGPLYILCSKVLIYNLIVLFIIFEELFYYTQFLFIVVLIPFWPDGQLN